MPGPAEGTRRLEALEGPLFPAGVAPAARAAPSPETARWLAEPHRSRTELEPNAATETWAASKKRRMERAVARFSTALDGVSVHWRGAKIVDLVAGAAPVVVDSFVGHSFEARQFGTTVVAFEVGASSNDFVVAGGVPDDVLAAVHAAAAAAPDPEGERRPARRSWHLGNGPGVGRD